MRLAGILPAILTATSPALADQVFDLGQKASLPNDMTWRDVVRLVFPDLRQEPRKDDGRIGDFIYGDISLRPIGKYAFEDDCQKEPLRIEYIETARVELSGKMREIVAITTDGDACCFGALALFDGGRDAKLLDVVNIQQDQNYGFGNGFARRLGPDGRLVVADSFHTTTSSSPDNYVLVLATIDKLTRIGNVDARGEVDCDHHRTIAENPYVVVTPDYGAFDRVTGLPFNRLPTIAGHRSASPW